MNKFLAAATVIALMACSGNTSSDKYSNKHTIPDSTDTTMKTDSIKPKDTIYPSTDTASYRKGKAKPVDTTK
ncbi:MAG: hypothetical protein IT249_19375 [Chitinophagaceae bacterium]|nr:hypothetical protein [Chitinophagaceae bacterium]